MCGRAAGGGTGRGLIRGGNASGLDEKHGGRCSCWNRSFRIVPAANPPHRSTLVAGRASSLAPQYRRADQTRLADAAGRSDGAVGGQPSPDGVWRARPPRALGQLMGTPHPDAYSFGCWPAKGASCRRQAVVLRTSTPSCPGQPGCQPGGPGIYLHRKSIWKHIRKGSRLAC
jgi:hypothetical protein